MTSEYDRKRIKIEKASDRLRLHTFTEIGSTVFKGTGLVENKTLGKTDETSVDLYLLQIAPFAHPKIRPSFWEHTVILAPCYAELLAKKTDIMDPIEGRIIAKLHDIGTLINPIYLRKEFISASLMKALGIKEEITESFSPVPWIIGVGNSIESMQDLTERQRFMDIADNLGKIGPGGLLTIKAFIEYAKGQPLRYPPDIWPSTRVGHKRLTEKGKQDHAIQLVAEEIKWLQEEYGLNFDELRRLVQAEFEKPENQGFLTSLLNAQETLDPEVDRKLGREPIGHVVLDIGGVLLNARDEDLIEGMSQKIGVDKELIRKAFAELNPNAMAGESDKSAYLKKFAEIIEVKNSTTEDFVFPEIYSVMEGMQEVVSVLHQKSTNVWLYSNIIPPLTAIVRQKIKEYYPEIDPDKILFSCEVKASKQNKDSFEKAAKIIGEGGKLLVDDSEVNITNAAVSGWRKHSFRGNPNLAITRLKNEFKLAGLI